MSDDWREREYWRALSDAQLSGSQDHDRAILTLSSATLALSATFLHDIAPSPPGAVEFLVVSWGAFLAAIVLIVASFQVSQWAMQAAMSGQAGAVRTRTHAIVALNLLADVGFVVGIVTFVFFARQNL